MPKKHVSLSMIVLLGISILLVLSYQLFTAETDTAEMYDRIDSLLLDPTVLIEKTFIARFTESPESATFSTPFYGEILYNEAVRQMRMSPTPDALNPTPDCWLVPDYWPLERVSSKIEQAIERINIQAHVEVFSSILWNSEICGEYILVSNQITIWIDLPIDTTLEIPSGIEAITRRVVDDIGNAIQNEENITQIPENIAIWINFETGSGSEGKISTNWLTASEAVSEPLEESSLLDTLGGLQIEK